MKKILLSALLLVGGRGAFAQGTASLTIINHTGMHSGRIGSCAGTRGPWRSIMRQGYNYQPNIC